MVDLNNLNQLLAKLANHDEASFKIIYDYYHKTVYDFAFLYLKEAADAEEVVQDVFIKVWGLGNKSLEIVNLQAYIKTLTKNSAIDAIRSKASIKRKNNLYTIDFNGINNDTEEAILQADLNSLLEKAILLLPTQQRQVYKLCAEDGLRNDDVANQLNLSPLTVRTHKKLALRFLRNYIRKHLQSVVFFILFFLILITHF